MCIRDDYIKHESAYTNEKMRTKTQENDCRKYFRLANGTQRISNVRISQRFESKAVELFKEILDICTTSE